MMTEKKEERKINGAHMQHMQERPSVSGDSLVIPCIQARANVQTTDALQEKRSTEQKREQEQDDDEACEISIRRLFT